MDKLSQAQLEHKYSWWWDSHICPKNSRWLQENLADMDSNIKSMIKLIEEDADSFARRAEMYFKKRPELMKLVEEFYRAYRALAERYDHATGELRQAHRTISEAFPNQIPSLLLDDAPTSSASETDPRTPEIATPAHGYFDTENLEHDYIGPSLSYSHASKQNNTFSEHPDSISSKNSLEQLNSLFRSLGPRKSVKGRVRKGLKFYEVAKSELVSKLEKEILHSKETLVKLESEKEAGLIQYQQSLEHLSRHKAAVSRAKENSEELSEQASKAEAEIQALKKALFNLKDEKEVSLLQYQLCMEKISNLQGILSHVQQDAGDLDERTNKAEADTQTLKQDLARVEAEKNVVLDQYKQSLELTSDLERNLLLAEERAQQYCERAEVAECEVQTLKIAISKLIEAKEAAALKYEQCLERISSLELKISSAHEEVKKRNGEIDSKLEKLLHSELETLVLKMDTQNEELMEKQKELGRLWACIQEERLRFMEAETAYQSLQPVHSQTEEDLRSLASELQSMAYILRNVETHNDSLQVERLKLKNENKSLNELNLSSTMSMKGLKNEIDRLKKTNRKLEEELDLQVDQRNSLKQEIYCLTEELRDLNHKHLAFLKQVDAVGLSEECFELSVKELQDENSNLRISYQRERSDKATLLEKLEKLLDKNTVLQNSLLALGDELEAVRRKINVLEVSCHSLLQEKSTVLDENASLMTRLQLTTENLGKHLEKNTILENTLSDTLDELDVSEERVKSLRDSCLLLANQKTGLISEKNTLVSQVEMIHQSLSNLEKRSTELEEKCSALEKDKKSTMSELTGLEIDLEVQKQKSTAQLACLVNQVHLLRDESGNRYRELEGELDKALDYEVENFVLRRCVHDLKDKTSVLSIECQKFLETSKLSKKLISELEQENLEQSLEVKSLFEQHNSLRVGMSQLLKALNIVLDHGCVDIYRQEKTSLENIISKVEYIKSSLAGAQDENQLRAVEMSVLVTLIAQLKSEAAKIQMEKSTTDQELRVRSEQCLIFESESRKLSKMTEELILKVMDGYHKEEELMTRMENLHGMLLVIQEAYDNLQEEKDRVVEEKQILMQELLDMKKMNNDIEEEKYYASSDILSLDILSLIFRNYVNERFTEMRRLGEDLHKLRGANAVLQKNWSVTEEKLDGLQVENLNLKEKLHKSDDDLKAITSVVGKLNQDIASDRDLLCQKQMDLLEAEHKLIIRENENSLFTKEMENLRWEHDAVQMIREDLEKQMVKLSKDSAHLLKENQCLSEAKQKFEVELSLVHGLYATSRNKENFLFSEVQKKNDEIGLWQTQATTLYGELQTSTITRTLLEDKVNELIEECNSLHAGNTVKDVKIELPGQRIGILEGKNEELKSQLVSFGPAVTSLMDTVSSLEMHTFMHKNTQEPINEEIKEVELENQNAVLPYALTNMQDLQARVRAIEKTIIEMARLATQENLNAYNKLESTVKQMEELRSENRSLKGKVQPISEISEASGVLSKDIMLDHISESSFYGTSRRHYFGPDNQMLELWETADQNSSIDLSIGKGKKVVGAPTKYERFEAVKLKSEDCSSDSLIEKELGMNILEISKRFRETRQEGNKRKVLERLNSDVLKLTNLQITVQDLKRKVAIIERSRNCKAITESDSVKQKLEDAEAAIRKLFDLNEKLVKNVEDNSTYSGKMSSIDSGDGGSVRRKRISEQARRASEKIGRLQLEIQRIQFDLLKVDDGKESIGKFRLTETKRKVVLRDYIYAGPKNSPRRKKATFCACMEPPTKGDLS